MLIAGSKLGPYEILAPLGAGGMGEVYRARDTRLDRTVAIKVLPAHLSRDPERRQRFEREARAVSSLSHPHIGALYDIGREGDTDYLVLEYLEGETLAKRLEKGAMPTGELLRIATEVSDALDKAHRQGVLHRDLKPGNIMLTKSGAKLLDFGLAKPFVAPNSALTAMVTGSKPLTVEGMIVGTFQYMAPEQLEGKEADARSDIFAFGATLYEMATGKKAFEGKTTASVIAAVLASEPTPISSLQPLTPPAFERLVKTCLAKDPDERFQSAHDINLQLQWIAEAGSQAGVPAPVVARRKIRERIWWAVSGLLLLLALLATGAYLRLAMKPERVVRAFVLPPEKTTFELEAGPAVISPDGLRLAFIARTQDGKSALWLKPMDAVSAQPLAGADGATYPFWSPDSHSIGFFADSKLKKIDASGGPSQTLCDVLVGRGGSWNSKGVILFSPGATGNLYRIAAAGGPASPVTKLDPSRQEVTHRWPDFLPDGNHFLFYIHAGNADTTGTYIGSLDGAPPRLLVQGDSNAVYAPQQGELLFVRERVLMAQPFDASGLKLTGDPVPIAENIDVDINTWKSNLAVSQNGVLIYHASSEDSAGWALKWLDRTGKDVGVVGQPELYFAPALSPDGRRLAVSIQDSHSGNIDIWVYDLARGVKTRLTFNPAVDTTPAWSPDGSKIAFVSNRKGLFHIYQKPANGTGSTEPLLETAANELLPSWSTDGKYLAYTRLDTQAKKDTDIWILPLFGNRKPFPFLQTTFNEANGQFSPDGQWLAYVSNESGRQEVYAAPFPSGNGKWQLSTGGGRQPKWRGDGRELYYLDPGNQLMAVDIKAAGATLEVGNAHVLFQPHRPAGSNQQGKLYDVTPDGKRFLVVSQIGVGSSAPITLVLNWPALLKNK